MNESKSDNVLLFKNDYNVATFSQRQVYHSDINLIHTSL